MRIAISWCTALMIGTIANTQALEITPLSDGLFLHQSEKEVEGFGKVSANGLIIVDGKEAFVVDTPWTDADAEALLEWTKAKDLTVKAVLATHWHEDRAGSFGVFERAGIATLSSEATQALLRQHQKTLATHTFSGDEIQYFGNKVEVFYPGAGHAMDNLVVYLPHEKLLFGGCLVREASTRFMGFYGDGSLPDWPESMSRLIAKFPEVITVVPGHGALGDKRLLEHTRGLAEAALKAQ
ncbi:subclass B1 metallo-beta-lactamase [Shewanella amazonensis]|uniref:beta-lactamase n=1 Tax=Shewanella amazonensis (strain ATCC BAA-1098 / SB2B) TaxID=326297 RepID=A1S4S9_SHEAM|nr:subclass B1 metallo-beta-lactamase [Shewanella amazonensis]ABL99385.1 Beta-lactamase [Shewanella amazonensis SB2B]